MMPIYEQCLTLVIFFYTLSHKTPKIEWNLDCFTQHTFPCWCWFAANDDYKKSGAAYIHPRSRGNKIIWKLIINKISTTKQESFDEKALFAHFTTYSSICNQSEDRTTAAGFLRRRVPLVEVGCWMGILEVVVAEVGRFVADLTEQRQSTPKI
jgi:hypothetical protein